MSTSVTLDAGRKVLFPDCCILCGQRGPGDEFSLPAGTQGNWRRFLGLRSPGRDARVPACSRCRELLDRQRQLRSGGMLLAVLVAAACYGVLLFCYHGPLQHVVRAGGLVFFMLPYLVWEAVFPLPINVTTVRKKTIYQFEYELYAIEFARLNRAQKSVSNAQALLSEGREFSEPAEADPPIHSAP